jgi:hypothetical protein
MVSTSSVVSKVLVLDGDERHRHRIRAFCEANGLVALKAVDGDAMSLLQSNVDLGAILLWEHHGGAPGRGIEIGHDIHRLRPELPIFLRRDKMATLDDLPEPHRRAFRAAYTARHMGLLRDAIGVSLFSRVYPTALVRGITEVTKSAIEGQYPHLEVEPDAPCMVKDRIIYGELFTLIPLESNWCRGYMMMQTEEQRFIDFLCDPLNATAGETDFREINNLLGETTNMVWGAFKNRFIGAPPEGARLSQVPIIVNHLRRYISFGSEDPLLSVRYHITDRREPARGSIVVYQWFAFNLAWTPDKFKENESMESLYDSGELELF